MDVGSIKTAGLVGGTNASLFSLKKDFTRYRGGYTLSMADRTGQAQIPGERRPMLSDGGNSRVREQQTGTDSAEPPSLTDSLL